MTTQNTPNPQGDSLPNEYTNKKRKQSSQLVISDEDENSLTFPRYLIASANDNQPIKYNIFAIQKFVQCGVGDVKSAKKLRNGTVLIEVSTKEQAQKALNMTTWFDTPITVTAHRSLNTSRGVIRCRDLRDCDDADVLNALSSQGVVEVKHIFTKRNDKLEPTNTFILTFNLPSPPKAIKAAYMKIDVELYIPNPLRCYKCQRFGHGKTACNRNAACAKCGQEGHDDKDCQNPPHCANCSGDHTAYSKECPVWYKQCDITRLKHEKNISFYEAKQIVEQRDKNNATSTGTKRLGLSYAKAASQTHTVSTQTDLTWPLGTTLPVALANVKPRRTAASSTSQTEAIHSSDSSGEEAVGGSETLPPKTNIPHYGNSQNNKVNKDKPGPASRKGTNRTKKGSNDPVKTYNKYSSLDEMELELDSSVLPRTKTK